MILEEIAAKTKERIEEEKSKRSLKELKAIAAELKKDTGFPFEAALAKPGMSFICEVKKASPSKGIIAEHFPLNSGETASARTTTKCPVYSEAN